MEKSIIVKFIRSGTAFGFGYGAGTIAEIGKSDYDRLRKIEKDNKCKIIEDAGEKEKKSFLETLKDIVS